MKTLRQPFVKILLLLSSCLCFSGVLSAEPSKLESHSPFLPPGYSNKPKQPPQRAVQRATSSPLTKDLEFRGVVQLNGAYVISLFKKSENKSYWITEDGSEDGMSVSKFDADSMKVTVTSDGRSEQLSLMAASENPLPVVTGAASATASKPIQPPIPAPSSNVQPAANSTRQATNTARRRTIPRRRISTPQNRN